jgi:serine/threonine protein kinase
MVEPSSHLSQLSADARKEIAAYLAEFERTWNDASLDFWVRASLPSGGALRVPALIEMVKVDLRRRLERGDSIFVERYLQLYPDLGTTETASVDLLITEYLSRAGSRNSADLTDYARRFPRQFEELVKHVSRLSESSGTDDDHVSRATRSLYSDEKGASRPTLKPVLPEQFGRYRILQSLGQGGMGSVYLAYDSQLDRQVALKVPHFTPEEGEKVLDRFLQEARAAATLNHPNICPVYDASEVDGIRYVTMAYIEGKTLAEMISNGRALPEHETANIVQKLAIAMYEAHTKGVVHRDLKPANVMINLQNEPVIMDFGLARRLGPRESHLTQSGAVVGTPAYMAPEQVEGKAQSIGPHSDVYSMGVILYEMLSGRLPFEGSTAAILGQIMFKEPLPPSAHRVDVSPELEAVCLKAMAKKASDRYESMADLAFALTDLLKVEPPPSPPARKTARWVLGATLLVLLSASLGLGFLTFMERWPTVPPGFQPSADGETELVQGKRYYRQIFRPLVDGTKVKFLLIPKRANSDDPETFYIMEDKVWVSLFQQFVAAVPDECKNQEWKKGGLAGETYLNNKIGRHPVLAVHVEDAYRFARWLGGKLPATHQWDKAAGRFENTPRPGPFEPDWPSDDKSGIAIDRSQQGPLVIGDAKKDISPFGCRDMSGNGWEWTRNLIKAEGLVPYPGAGEFDSVLLRGRSYAEQQPLRFKDLTENLESQPYLEPSCFVGFRVVIEP